MKVIFLILILGLTASGQLPAGSSARTIPTVIEKLDARVSRIIAKAEDHFRKGKIWLDDNKREQARKEFNRAIDTILDSGLDVRTHRRLQEFYFTLVELIYHEEVPSEPDETIGFRDQKAELSPFDVLGTRYIPQAQQGWTFIGKSSSEHRMYVRNIKRTGNIINYWVKFTYSDNSFSVWREQANCTENITRTRGFVEYDQQGHPSKVSTGIKWSAWQDLIPDSLGESVHEYVCKKKG